MRYPNATFLDMNIHITSYRNLPMIRSLNLPCYPFMLIQALGLPDLCLPDMINNTLSHKIPQIQIKNYFK